MKRFLIPVIAGFGALVFMTSGCGNKVVKANSVQIVHVTGTLIMGEIGVKIPGLFATSVPQGEAMGPVKVIIFREIAP